MLQSTLELGIAMATRSRSQVTIEFVSVGLKDGAFAGKHAPRHLKQITNQVSELFERHSIMILCMVEVGQPRIGLSQASQALFEEAVVAGAANYINAPLKFLWGGWQ